MYLGALFNLDTFYFSQSEVSILRKQISESSSHGSSDDQPVSAAAMSILMPHLVNERNALLGTGSSTAPTNPGLVAALRQRTTMLQEENDELYNVLRRAETGRLDEEVKGLRLLVGRLERALRGRFSLTLWLTLAHASC